MTIVTEPENYGTSFTNRFGELLHGVRLEGEGARLYKLYSEQFGEDYGRHDEKTNSLLYREGDPRRFFNKEELSFVHYRNGRLGILIEGELDITIGDETSDGLTRDNNGSLVVSPDQMAEAAEYWLSRIEPLRSEFPETEFFVSHGKVAYDGRLQVNSFTPLIEKDMKFYSPYLNNELLPYLEEKLSSLLYDCSSTDANRIYRQLVMSNVSIRPAEDLLVQAVGAMRAADVLKRSDYEMVAVLVRKYGSHETCALLNQALGTSLNIGEYVIASVSEQGMWCNDFGWVEDRYSATGYSKETAESGVKLVATLDAEFVLYDDVEQYFLVNKKAA